MELNKNLGNGGAGMHGTGPGTAANALRALMGLRISLVAGAAADTKLPVEGLTEDSKVISVLNNNSGTFSDVTATASIVDTRATGTVTVGAMAAGDTVTVAGVRYTILALGTKVEPYETNKVVLRAGDTATTVAARLAEAINATEHASMARKVKATSAAAVVTVRAFTPGAAGNAITLAETGSTFTISGATLATGSDTEGLKVSSTTNQLVVFWLPAL